ncbi:MAG: hypothetical protein OXF63_00255 [Anaerolineaceae bacterium]|nr:hypothetical protein [Anaerolineaceae bacterium]
MNGRPGAPVPRINGLQVVFAVILTVALTLAINFSTRISAGRPLQEARRQVLAEIESLRADQANLIAERDHAHSDFYVQRWARDEGKMVRPGERLVIPVPTENTLYIPPVSASDGSAALRAEVQTLPRRTPNWQLWWTLFFDQPPPDLDG